MNTREIIKNIQETKRILFLVLDEVGRGEQNQVMIEKAIAFIYASQSATKLDDIFSYLGLKIDDHERKVAISEALRKRAKEKQVICFYADPISNAENSFMPVLARRD